MKKFIAPLVLVLIFLTSFLLMVFSARMDSQTTDEGIHLYAGYTYLTKDDFRLDPEHPPLLKELSALPLLFLRNLNVPSSELWDQAENFYFDSWYQARVLGETFFYTLGNDPAKLLFWGRLPFIFLTLILGLVSFLWAKKLYGKKAGIFAAFLILFLPNILAHGRLVNTDLGLTLFMFLTIYFWGKFLKTPKYLTLILSGIFLGMALASKFTSIIILPIMLAILIARLFFEKKDEKNGFGKYILGFLGAFFVSIVVVWASYGFSIASPPAPLISLSNNITMWTAWNVPTTFDGLFEKLRPFLFPADYYKGLFLVLRHAASGHGSFLLGQISNTGWWYYFPVAIFFKTPIPLFLFLGLAIYYFKKLRAKDVFDELLLIIPPVAFLIFSMTSKADLGIRHVLPIFPFLIVFASKSINLIDLKKTLAAIVFVLAILWYLLASIISFPNYLAYFNEFAGGKKNDYKILADSNLDWGQDLYRLKNYLDTHNISKVKIVYPWDGNVALDYYNISYEPLAPEETDVHGPVVISATYLQTEAYGWLKQYPLDQITPGLFLINLP